MILGGGFAGQAWIGADLAPPSPFMTAFLLALAADGSIAWTKLIEGTVVDRVALDQGDVVAVMTTTSDKIIIDGHELAGSPSGKTLVARFDPTGALRYVIPFEGGGLPIVTGLIIDSAGHALISGNTASPFVLAGAKIDPAGRSTTFIAELDRSGAPVRNFTFGCGSSPLSSPSRPADHAMSCWSRRSREPWTSAKARSSPPAPPMSSWPSCPRSDAPRRSQTPLLLLKAGALTD